ncbi:ArsR/SmtB family transcription factor [Micromonospora endophytica]|uniref:Transcriptional regulator n=1 Tax=Micromonospora endophytica TaxID=515350 RepID=A0A2W2BRJ7_9ACTN|nr:helix-turn-helix domain-containing protein [Micromonospora endophytica]PZF88090.1 transcriptional regulator [Micromonospora endophytica]RIW43615.1 transcriptional regulator [Micromonospora endophytica]BCJ60335.1 transcriptional regulator [Micromonospora endophytica]
MSKHAHPDLADVPVTTVLSSLSDPLRLGVVRLLSDGQERQWGELDAPVAASTLSHHMKVLRSAGITRTRDEGTRCYVHLRRDELDAHFPGLLDSILNAPELGVTTVGIKRTR